MAARQTDYGACLSDRFTRVTPLANLIGLEELELSNQFPTDENAYLSVQLERTHCGHFAPYLEIASPINGKDVMVTGSKKPFLNKTQDSERLAKYVKKFEDLRKAFTADKASQPTPNRSATDF